MVENAPILPCQHAGLTIEGYSRAAVQSYWRIPELKIGFDLGAQPWDFMGTPSDIILAKLDGTAKGGASLAIKQKLDLPVKFIGVGEKLDDLEPLDPDAYVEALFA